MIIPANFTFTIQSDMRIAIIGYGRMGKTIEKVAVDRGHKIVMKVASNNSHSFNEHTLKQSNADVAIEFSSPEAAFQNLKNCFLAGIPVICGTTAWLDDWDKTITFMEKNNGSFLYASNFSLGVNVFFEVNKKLAQIMSGVEGYKPTIHEVHHTGKKDAPSGTAITLGNQIIENHIQFEKWTDDVNSADNLIITSERIDPAPGTHHVRYSSDVDTIELIHTAKSRNGFALGAVLAAEYLQGKSGLHAMTDVLKI